MAEQKEIIVKASEEQRKNFIDIGIQETSPIDRQYKKLVEKQQECTELHVPFCYQCAKQDFEEETRRAVAEIVRNPFTREERESKQKKIPLNLKDLEEYAKPSYFNLIDTKVRKEVTVVDGTKMSRPAYQEYNYKCKTRKHGISVQVPWYEHLEKEKATVKK